MTLHPETCPCCGKEDAEAIDDDGPSIFYRCDKCSFTWRQRGEHGRPIISSFGSDSQTKLYRAFRNAGYSEARARTAAYGEMKNAKLVKIGGRTWQILRVFSSERAAANGASNQRRRGLTVQIRKTTIKISAVKRATRWVLLAALIG